ncbi:hypothetical protein GWI33_021416 [Rhynchophorus ferrugineus]|uniref:Uncharacterized protein n=1 Tax=Rhynchophorus ferrugineus TaxID=354439 RepID=A0A834M2G1_RHYFE|nr:hypothetical protein GWI33_021416 [Rhynchophorus ferrugineus]
MIETFDENKTKTDNRLGQIQGSGVGYTTTGKKIKCKVNITMNEWKQMLREVKVQVWPLLLENRLIRDLDITQGCDHFGILKYDNLVAMADIKHFEFSMETVKKKCLLGRESA